MSKQDLSIEQMADLRDRVLSALGLGGGFLCHEALAKLSLVTAMILASAPSEDLLVVGTQHFLKQLTNDIRELREADDEHNFSFIRGDVVARQ